MPPPLSNLLLESLPAAERTSLLDKLEPIALPVDTVLFEPDEQPRHLYFVTSGIASIVTTMSGGGAVEVGLMGREGLPGSIFLLGSQTGLTRCMMQVEGAGLRMRFKQFEQEFFSSPTLHRRILEHVQHDSLVLTQLSACNRLHEVEERMARWLLMVADRLESPELPLTQEFLSEMLGTRRSTVTITAGTLQRGGLIRYGRGHIQILDREGLQDTACECYPVVQKLYRNLYRQPVR